MKNALEVSHLTKDYGSFKLDDVSFTVPGGTIMGLIGENGAGKSTTIKCILNLIRRDGGEIQVLGLDNLRDEQAVKAQVGVVLDETTFHDVLTAPQVGKILAKLYPNWDMALYQRYLDKFGLAGKKPVKTFSKGMKMKLSLAAAFAARPKLLILDEATSGLDPVVRDEILDEFLDFIQDEEHAILLSSHITSDLEKVADPALLVGVRTGQFGCEALVRDKHAFTRFYPGLTVDPVTLEDIMVFTVKGDAK